MAQPHRSSHARAPALSLYVPGAGKTRTGVLSPCGVPRLGRVLVSEHALQIPQSSVGCRCFPTKITFSDLWAYSSTNARRCSSLVKRYTATWRSGCRQATTRRVELAQCSRCAPAQVRSTARQACRQVRGVVASQHPRRYGLRDADCGLRGLEAAARSSRVRPKACIRRYNVARWTPNRRAALVRLPAARR